MTGATGFKGMVVSLAKILGSKVYGIGNNPNSNKKLFYELGLNKKIKTSLFDIRDYKKLEKLVNRIKPQLFFI